MAKQEKKKKGKRWYAYGAVVGTKYIGEIEAETEEEAIDKAWKMADVSLCHQCAPECENAEIESVNVEEIE